MSDGEDSLLRQEALAQRLGAISLNQNLGEPDPDASALFGLRDDSPGEKLRPTAATVSRQGKKRQVKNDAWYKAELQKVEAAVNARGKLIGCAKSSSSRLILEVDEVVNQSSSPSGTSPYTEYLAWLESQRKALDELGTLPKHTSATLGVLRKTLQSTIKTHLIALAELDDQWHHKRGQEEARRQVDHTHYGETRDSIESGNAAPEPFVVECGESLLEFNTHLSF